MSKYPSSSPRLLLATVAAKACLMLVEATVGIALPFETSDHHDLESLDLNPSSLLLFVVFEYLLFGNSTLDTSREH